MLQVILEVSILDAGSTSNHIDHELGVDEDGGVNDRQVEMLIDSISFHGYNHTIKNVTEGKLTDGVARQSIELKTTPIVTNPPNTWTNLNPMGATNRASKVANDNFYTQAKTPSPTVVAFGFDSKTGLANKFLQFNNYRTALGAASGEIHDEFIEWGYSDKSVSAGGVTTGCLNLAQDTDIVTDGALAVDNFSKKGYL